MRSSSLTTEDNPRQVDQRRQHTARAVPPQTTRAKNDEETNGTRALLATHRLDRHARAVEREREEGILPPIPFELRSEYRLRQAERVAEVQMAIAVRIWERHYELLLTVRLMGIAFERLLALPHGLDLELGRAQGVSLSGSLGRSCR